METTTFDTVPPSPDTVPAVLATRRQLWAWCIFDWANSAFFTVILTFVFSAYFAKEVAASLP